MGNIWDFDMIDHTWLMTEKGLDCTDCLKARKLEEDTEDTEAEEIENQSDSVKNEERVQISQAQTKTIGGATLTAGPLYRII